MMSEDAAPSGAVHLVDRGETVDVVLGLPPDASDLTISISGGGDSLKVAVEGQPLPLLEVLQLYSTVDPERTQQRIDDGRLIVTLHKRDPSLAWPGLHAVREEPESQQVGRNGGCVCTAWHACGISALPDAGGGRTGCYCA